MGDEPFLLRLTFEEALRRRGIQTHEQFVKYAKPHLERRIPPRVRLFVDAELRKAAIADGELIRDVQQLEDRAMEAFGATITAAKEEGMVEANVNPGLSVASRTQLLDFEREMEQLDEIMESVERKITQSTAARLDTLETGQAVLHRRMSEAFLLGLTDRWRGERASSLRIMIAIAAATTALLAATFQFEGERGEWYLEAAWATFGIGVLVVLLAWGHAVHAGALAKVELDKSRDNPDRLFDKDAQHVPTAAWLWITAATLTLQLAALAVALRASVLR